MYVIYNTFFYINVVKFGVPEKVIIIAKKLNKFKLFI